MATNRPKYCLSGALRLERLNINLGNERFARICLAVGIAVCSGGMLGLAMLQYMMPQTFISDLGLNNFGVSHYCETLWGTTPPENGSAEFVEAFRLLLWSTWSGYFAAVAVSYVAGAPRCRLTLTLVGGLAFLLAIWCPPSLSTDVYAYVAYARLPVLFGRNPYLSTPSELITLGDPTSRFIGYLHIPCVYGPVWVHIGMIVVWAMRHATLWWQVTAFKLLGAASLMAVALAGRELAERYRAGSGRLALLAIALNPLLLLEGPCNGHNDLMMMALMLWAFALHRRGLTAMGCIALGLAIGIKFVPAAVIPWMMLTRGRGLSPLRRARAATLGGLLSLAPVALAYFPLWEGQATFTAQQMRATWGRGVGYESARLWLVGRGWDDATTATAVRMIAQWPVIVLYLALTLIVVKWPDFLLDAWTILSVALFAWSVGIRFPWYMAWPICSALTRWNSPRLALSFLTLSYASILALEGYIG